MKSKERGKLWETTDMYPNSSLNVVTAKAVKQIRINEHNSDIAMQQMVTDLVKRHRPKIHKTSMSNNDIDLCLQWLANKSTSRNINK